MQYLFLLILSNKTKNTLHTCALNQNGSAFLPSTSRKELRRKVLYDETLRTKKYLSKPLDNKMLMNILDDKIFKNPAGETIGCSHPLGGCHIGADANGGVVDEFGHVFDSGKTGQARPFHEGLYIADASVIPSALGVNPSLSITAVCWHFVGNIRKELY